MCLVLETFYPLTRVLGCCTALILLVGCIEGGNGEPNLAVTVAPGTYETCGGRGFVSDGVNFLSSASGPVGVKIEMSECELIRVLGMPTSLVPGPQVPGRRRITMVYANQDGTQTHYVFLNNALREINLTDQSMAPVSNIVGSGQM